MPICDDVNKCLVGRIVNGIPISERLALRVYANIANWTRLYDQDGAHWVWKGPVIVGWELATQVLSGISKVESLSNPIHPITTKKEYCRLEQQCCPGCVYTGGVRPYCRIHERDLVPGDRKDERWIIIERPPWCSG